MVFYFNRSCFVFFKGNHSTTFPSLLGFIQRLDTKFQLSRTPLRLLKLYTAFQHFLASVRKKISFSFLNLFLLSVISKINFLKGLKSKLSPTNLSINSNIIPPTLTIFSLSAIVKCCVLYPFLNRFISSYLFYDH